MGNAECGIKGNKKDYGGKMNKELGTRIYTNTESGILQPYRLSEAKGAFVLTKPRAKDYPSEYNELCGSRRIQS